MRRHVHPGNHSAESFVSFIPLFDRLAFEWWRGIDAGRPAQQPEAAG
jgi:hypothetical protein